MSTTGPGGKRPTEAPPDAEESGRTPIATPHPQPQADWWDAGKTEANLNLRSGVRASPSASSANTAWRDPRLPAPRLTPTTSVGRVDVPTAILLLSGVAMVVGSVTAWVTVSFLGHSASVDGTNSGITRTITLNGWYTLVVGVLIVVSALLMAVSSQSSLESVTAVVAVVGLGFAVYDLVRILQKISDANSRVKGLNLRGIAPSVSTDVGYGLIILVV